VGWLVFSLDFATPYATLQLLRKLIELRGYSSLLPVFTVVFFTTNAFIILCAIRRRRSCQKPRYTSPRSQLVITAMLVSVEVFINVIWLFFDRPAVTYVYPSRDDNILICSGSDNASYLIGLVYPSILMRMLVPPYLWHNNPCGFPVVFCTMYAFKTRKCPEGFNEARYLTFTNYTTCVIWLAFLPLFVLSTSTAIRAVTLSCLLSISAAVQLACLFFPKVKSIVWISYILFLNNIVIFRIRCMWHYWNQRRILRKTLCAHIITSRETGQTLLKTVHHLTVSRHHL